MSFTNYIKTLFQTHYIGFGYVLQYESPYNLIHVSQILQNSPASESILRVSDSIIAINGTMFSSEESFLRFMNHYRANTYIGTATTLTFQRKQESPRTIVVCAAKVASLRPFLIKIRNLRAAMIQRCAILFQFQGIASNTKTGKIEIFSHQRVSREDIENLFH